MEAVIRTHIELCSRIRMRATLLQTGLSMNIAGFGRSFGGQVTSDILEFLPELERHSQAVAQMETVRPWRIGVDDMLCIASCAACLYIAPLYVGGAILGVAFGTLLAHMKMRPLGEALEPIKDRYTRETMFYVCELKALQSLLGEATTTDAQIMASVENLIRVSGQ